MMPQQTALAHHLNEKCSWHKAISENKYTGSVT